MPKHRMFRPTQLRFLCLSISSALYLTSVPTSLFAATIPVTFCGDEQMGVPQPGSLRDVVTHSAQSGDIVDLSTCKGSTITLKNGAIPVTQDSMTLIASTPDSGAPPTVTIDGDGTDRVLIHGGRGTLSINSVIVQNGNYARDDYLLGGGGGCITSAGSLELNHSVVRGCKVQLSANTYALGGGVYVYCGAKVTDSVVSDNSASSGGDADGGGIFQSLLHDGYGCDVTIEHSSITGNTVYGKTRAYAGAVFVQEGSTTIAYSTISGNKAGSPGGAAGGGIIIESGDDASVSNIRNSTVSGNSAESPVQARQPSVGGLLIFDRASSTATISNSTIAFNDGDTVGGVSVVGGTVDIESTIIANNTKANGSVPSDFYQVASTSATITPATITGASNLVMSASFPLPFGFNVTIADPMLGPLQNNGGPTFTHALLPGSPALALGNNKAALMFDQRGPGFSRTTGSTSDIGAFEYNATVLPPLVNPDQHGLTGSWFNPATSGQGFEIEVFPDLIGAGQGFLFAGWFTYDVTAAGGRRWYSLAGNVSAISGATTLQIYDEEGGNFNALPSVSAKSVLGQATIAFSDCTTASLSYTFTDGSNRSGTIALKRLSPNVTCSPSGDNGSAPSDYLLSGSWYNPETSGQGLLFDISPSIGNLFAAWYTFLPNGQTIEGPASQNWFTLQATFTDGTTSLANIPIIETSGGIFDNPAGVTRVQVGAATISFQSCSAMTLTYQFTDGANQGLEGTIPLKRVLPAPTGCQTE
jgi:hypothetical protein